MTDAIVVLITAGNEEEAGKISMALVEEKLVACANIVPGIRSVFFWDGATRDEAEALLVCKSRSSLMDRIIARVKELHSYSVPEVIALPVIAGSASYLDWIRDTTSPAA